MTHKDYNSVMLDQIRNSVKDINAIAANEPFELFSNCVPEDVVRNTSRVMLTGCGDSYCASIAAKPVFENADTSTKTGMVPGTPTDALRNIEFSRYYNTYKGWEPTTLTKNLLCSVSISGSPRRPTEAARRMKEIGGTSVAFTTNPNSELAENSSYIIPMYLPSYGSAPNVTSYYTSMFSLMMFGFYMSRAKGQITMSQAEACRNGLLAYANSYSGSVMSRLSEQALELAEKWEKDGVEVMDFVGDGADYATAFFGSAKMVEAFGGLTTNDDSEGWCHINYFIENVDKVGTFIIADTDSPSFGRELETIRVMCRLRSHVAVITNGDASLFPENAVVFRTPEARSPWMHVFMQHIPMDLVAALIAEMRGTKPFRADSEIHQKDADCVRFRKSQIEIIR